MVIVIKSLGVNTLNLTKIKKKILSNTQQCYSDMVLECLDILKEGIPTQTELHNQTYYPFRERFKVPSQLAISARVYAWNVRKNTRKQGSNHRRISVVFDKRLFSLGGTKTTKNPVISLRTVAKRIGVLISVDGAYERFREHVETGWEATSVKMTSRFRFIVTVKKEIPEPQPMPNVLGIDVNSKHLAVTIKNPRTNRIIKQLYLGQDISQNQINFENRRGVLQGHRDTTTPQRAGKKLKTLSGRQRNFATTRLHQVVSDILKLAKEKYCTIVIEDLEKLRKSKTEWLKKSRKIVNRIPYWQFRVILEYKASIQGIPVLAVNPEYTSQMCSRCGNTTQKNWRNYSLFKCTECGFEVNRDRNASVNICNRANTTVTINDSRVQSPVVEAVVNQPVFPCDATCL